MTHHYFMVLLSILVLITSCSQNDPERVISSTSYRYTDNGDGTVTDNRSGLIWLKNANCFGLNNWYKAKKLVAKLAHGQCGLRDSSKAGIWRLPTRYEWKAMIDKKYAGHWDVRRPALSDATGIGPWQEGDVFSGVQLGYYWSSSAWSMFLFNGYMYKFAKTGTYYVWPVRGGE